MSPSNVTELNTCVSWSNALIKYQASPSKKPAKSTPSCCGYSLESNILRPQHLQPYSIKSWGKQIDCFYTDQKMIFFVLNGCGREFIRWDGILNLKWQ